MTGLAKWARRLVVGANGVCTLFTCVSLVPVAVIYPTAAELLESPVPSASLWAISRDALLCFGPLMVPFFLVLGALALRSAFLREPAALKLNGSAMAAWSWTLAVALLVAFR